MARALASDELWAEIEALLPEHELSELGGRPRCRPAKLHADKGYDFPFCRTYLRRRGICPRIARRGVESKERLGRYRWVVERSIAWLPAFRRLRIRYEPRADIRLGFLNLACTVIAWRFVNRFCSSL